MTPHTNGNDEYVTDGYVLISSRREWPWGLVLISDSTSKELLPGEMGSAVVVGVSTALVSKILHAVDGEATAEVWLERRPEALECVYQGDLTIPSGVLQLSDAACERIVSASVEPGTRPVQVYVDSGVHPERVVVSIGTVWGAEG
jgi:hypothetical protein